MTFAPAAARARMFEVKAACSLNAEAKERLAPGATSCTICSIARPSSVAPVQPEISWITVTGDKSLLTTSAAAPPRQLKLSESAPTLTPLHPQKMCCGRYRSASPDLLGLTPSLRGSWPQQIAQTSGLRVPRRREWQIEAAGPRRYGQRRRAAAFPGQLNRS